MNRTTIALSIGFFFIVSLVSLRSAVKSSGSEKEDFIKARELVNEQINLSSQDRGERTQSEITKRGIEVIRLEQVHILQTNTPVKVRGGTITFRTAPDLQFKKDRNNDDCVPLTGRPTVNFYADPVQSNVPETQRLPVDGQVDLFDHRPDGINEGNSGIRMVVTQTCGGSGLGLTLKGEPGTNSDFYKARDNKPDVNRTYIKRFKDPDCPRADDASSDPDSCERLFHVYVHTTPTNTPKAGSTKDWLCTYGDCVLWITQ